MMRILYLPVETSKRELGSKLLLALTCLEKNYFDEIYIGRHNELFERMSKPGVVLLKSSSKFELNKIKHLKGRGHVVYSLDEEGIIPPLNDPSINSRFSLNNFLNLDGLLINGPLELKSFPRAIRESDKIRNVGNPRFDFYKFKYRSFYNSRAKSIFEEFGRRRILLIASRFGDVNITEGVSYYKLLEDGGYIDSPESEKFFRGFLEHTKLVFEQFLELPDLIAHKFPDHLVVVRPHPSESHFKWVSKCTRPNIIVTSKHDIGSWLVSAQCLIHNGCTTAVEAAAVGLPVISFTPVRSETFDLTYANEVGHIAPDQSSLLRLLDQLPELRRHPQIRDISTIINHHDDVNASERIADCLAKKMPATMVYDLSARNLIRFYASFFGQYLVHLTGLKRYYFLKKYPHIRYKLYKKSVQDIQAVFGFRKRVKIRRVGIDLIQIRGLMNERSP